MGKNIIAYSLWGDNPKYWKGALKNVEINLELLPEFTNRFYIDSSCSKGNIEELSKYQVEIFIVDPKTSWHGMFWRFYATCDTDVDVFLSRDTDSRISPREISSIKEWIVSNKDFHIMRDHPYHTVPILGGMWGCKNGILRNMDQLIENWNNHTHKKGYWREVQTAGDQNFLAEVVYPLVVNNSMEHSEFNLRFDGEIRPFPSIRNNYEFVGDVFDENDVRNPDYWKVIKNTIINETKNN